MAKKKDPTFWLGHPVADEEHARKLHLKAAIHEFHHGLPRHEAEERAKAEDKRERIAVAAAHHLHGMKASNSIGNSEAAKKHHQMYSLHVKALGYDPMGPVPQDVKSMADQYGRAHDHVYDFAQHDDDQFLVQPVQTPGETK